MFNMDEKEITKFVEWLVKDGEAPAGSTFEEVVSWINELSTSQEGQQLLNKLIKTYQNKKSGLFKKGGRLHKLFCFKSGGKGPDCGCNKKVQSAQPGGEIYTGPIREGEYIPKTPISNVPKYYKENSSDFGLIEGFDLPNHKKYSGVYKMDGDSNALGFLKFGDFVYDDPETDKLFNDLMSKRNKWAEDPKALQKTLDFYGKKFYINKK